MTRRTYIIHTGRNPTSDPKRAPGRITVHLDCPLAEVDDDRALVGMCVEPLIGGGHRVVGVERVEGESK